MYTYIDTNMYNRVDISKGMVLHIGHFNWTNIEDHFFKCCVFFLILFTLWRGMHAHMGLWSGSGGLGMKGQEWIVKYGRWLDKYFRKRGVYLVMKPHQHLGMEESFDDTPETRRGDKHSRGVTWMVLLILLSYCSCSSRAGETFPRFIGWQSPLVHPQTQEHAAELG